MDGHFPVAKLAFVVVEGAAPGGDQGREQHLQFRPLQGLDLLVGLYFAILVAVHETAAAGEA